MLEPAEIYSLVVLVLLIGCNLTASLFWRRVDSIWGSRSMAEGAAAGFVFLMLLPEIEAAESLLGDRVHVIILLGFLVLYLIRQRLTASSGTRRSVLEVGVVALYQFLLVFTVAENLPHGPLLVPLYLMGIGAHLMLQNRSLEEVIGEERKKHGSVALIVALILGWLLHAFTDLPESFLDLLTALIAGLVLYGSLKGELSEDLKPRPVAFFAGALLMAASHWAVA